MHNKAVIVWCLLVWMVFPHCLHVPKSDLGLRISQVLNVQYILERKNEVYNPSYLQMGSPNLGSNPSSAIYRQVIEPCSLFPIGKTGILPTP